MPRLSFLCTSLALMLPMLMVASASRRFELSTPAFVTKHATSESHGTRLGGIPNSSFGSWTMLPSSMARLHRKESNQELHSQRNHPHNYLKYDNGVRRTYSSRVHASSSSDQSSNVTLTATPIDPDLENKENILSLEDKASFDLSSSSAADELKEIGTEQAGYNEAKELLRSKDLGDSATKSSAAPPEKTLTTASKSRPRYQLGLGKNRPLMSTLASSPENSKSEQNQSTPEETTAALNWNAPQPVSKPQLANLASDIPKEAAKKKKYDMGLGKNAPLHLRKNQNDGSATGGVGNNGSVGSSTTRHLLTVGDEMSNRLSKAVWDKGHFDGKDEEKNAGGKSVPLATSNLSRLVSQSNDVDTASASDVASSEVTSDTNAIDSNPSVSFNTQQKAPTQTIITNYQQIDLSVPPSVYCLGTPPTPANNYTASPPIDLVWDLMRQEALLESNREPLLVSFLHSTILNHPTLESALSFHLANRLSSPAMLSTQIMSLIREALDADPSFRRNLRADILAVRDRDPACTCLPDVFLYFKGFHALQSYRVAHFLYRSGRHVLAHYLQSQVSQNFQIDIHPNATLGSGIMLDHGTGIVIGETASLGHNCSVLHHVTLGGSGRRGVDRHPKVGNGVLLGAGASVLGNIRIGDGCQVGAGTLVIEDLPPRSVAVGVPAKIIGKFVDVTAQPSIGMNQLGSKEAGENINFYGMEGI